MMVANVVAVQLPHDADPDGLADVDQSVDGEGMKAASPEGPVFRALRDEVSDAHATVESMAPAREIQD